MRHNYLITIEMSIQNPHDLPRVVSTPSMLPSIGDRILKVGVDSLSDAKDPMVFLHISESFPNLTHIPPASTSPPPYFSLASFSISESTY